MEIQLRDYQVAAVDGTSAEWRKGNSKVQIVLPCGAGKTTVACEIVRRAVANGKRVLFMAHRRRLIQQIAERATLFGIPYSIEMANLPDGEGGEWVKTDPSAPLVIASRDTLISRAIRNDWTGLPVADLLFVDESHNLDSPQYTALAEKCRIKYRAGLSATPCKADGSGLGRRNWDAIVETATVRSLVASKHLVPVRCYAPAELGRLRKSGERTSVAGDPVDHWKRYAEGKRTVGFTSSVAEAVAVRDRFRAAGVPAEVISAKTPHEEREDIIRRVQSGEVLYLANCSVLVEGVDIPELEVCQLLCKCESYIRFIQAIGRIMRPAPWIGKEYGILLDHSAAVLVHGFPDEPVEWRLEEDDDLHARNKKDKEDGKRADPVLCAGCGCWFAGTPACPECGAVPPRREKKKEPISSAERLELLKREKEENPARFAYQQQREWTRLLHMCKAKGWAGTRASVMFRDMYGCYPERTAVRPLWPFDEMKRPVKELLEEAYSNAAGVS